MPADAYKVEERRRPVTVDYVYPAHMFSRRVESGGDVSFQSDSFYVGQALARLVVGLEVKDALHVRAWFRDIDLGLIETIPHVFDSCFEEVALRPKRVTGTAKPIARRKLSPSAGAAAALPEGDR